MQCNNHLGEFGHLLVLPRPPLANPEWVDMRTYSSLNEDQRASDSGDGYTWLSRVAELNKSAGVVGGGR